tara:strand:- start:231 stop:719 length:489 start_codon:yes stop_codon:yes gene_type:complete
MKKNYFSKRSYYCFFIIILIFFFDRFTKQYVIYLNELDQNSDLFSSAYLNIYLVWNEGIAFGLLSFNEEDFYNIISLIIFLVVLLILILLIKEKNIKKYPLSMILGGAISNFYDRIKFSAVPDFIDFHIGNFHWFIFNIADIFITLGIIYLIVLDRTYLKNN